MPLHQPRRIFARKKRLHGMAPALRAAAVLVFGFIAAFGATLLAAQWPEGHRVSRADLPAVFAAEPRRPDQPALRVAAAARGRPAGAGVADHEAGNEFLHAAP